MSIDTDLQGTKLDMMLIDDYESLAERAACLEEAFNLTLNQVHNTWQNQESCRQPGNRHALVRKAQDS